MQTLKMDFQSQSAPPVVPVMQSDSQSRFIGITLYDGGTAYKAPSGAVYTVEYHGPGANNTGWYDTIQLSSGTRKAVTVDSSNPNIVTLELAKQALRVSGDVAVSLCVATDTGYKLHTFPIICRVTGAPYVDPTSAHAQATAKYTVEFGELVGNGKFYFTRAYLDRPYFQVEVNDDSSPTITLLRREGSAFGAYIGAELSGVNSSTVSLVVFYCTVPDDADDNE